MSVFIDSNIPMYLIGADEERKTEVRRALLVLARAETRLVTSVEVFQEILHRYRALERSEAIHSAFDVLLRLSDEVFDVTLADALAARDLVLSERRPTPRDALHLAVMKRVGVSRILSFDRGFDGWPGVSRLGEQTT